MNNLKLALLVSGGLGFELFEYCYNKHGIAIVFTDSKSEKIIDFAKRHGVPIYIGNPRMGVAKEIIINNEVDVVFSINYLFLLEEDIIEWPSIAAINFHGSLLPKYRGRTPHVWAIINNEVETGVTAHLISKGCDEGDIVDQVKVKITKEDTGATVLKKYSEICPALLERVLDKISKEKLNPFPQENIKATYFGKRTPDDGEIDWNWQKERIFNWIRAQAFPYPGAFTFLNNHKITIDECQFDDFGFNQEIPNGLILTVNPVRVKTPNGVLILSKIREGEEQININKIFERYDN